MQSLSCKHYLYFRSLQDTCSSSITKAASPPWLVLTESSIGLLGQACKQSKKVTDVRIRQLAMIACILKLLGDRRRTAVALGRHSRFFAPMFSHWQHYFQNRRLLSLSMSMGSKMYRSLETSLNRALNQGAAAQPDLCHGSWHLLLGL